MLHYRTPFERGPGTRGAECTCAKRKTKLMTIINGRLMPIIVAYINPTPVHRTFSTRAYAMDSRVALFACAVFLAAFAADLTYGAPQKDAKPPAQLKDAKSVAAAGTQQKDDSAYTTKYDNIDVDQVLASKRLVNNYVQCLLDKKPCTPEGTELRRILPDALKTRCEKCNSKQKNTALRVVERLQKDYATEWKQLLDKWDPKREYLESFQKYIQEEKKKGAVKL